ncbi:MAG: hypothetical protein FWC45_07140 [Treponema sp.]|nr:hypothetical protein [Treponema sp.]
MKRILMAFVILVAAGTIAYAQQAATPTKQDMQQYLNQAKQNASQFDKMLADLKSRNNLGGDLNTYLRLKSEIDGLETRIKSEQASITARHNNGDRVGAEVMNSLERMVNQHKAKVAELEKLLSNMK